MSRQSAPPEEKYQRPERPPEERGSWGEVLHLAYPVVLSMLSWTIMWTVDTIFVGRVGTAEQGAVGFAGAVAWTLMCGVTGTLNGVQIFTAQYYGAKQYRRCGEVFWQGIYLALLAGTIALAAGMWGGGFVSLFRVAPELEPHAIVYFRIRVIGGVFLFLTYTAESFFRGIGDTKTPMKIAVFASMLNIILDYALIFGHLGLPRLEVAGAALATVISIAAQWIICMFILLEKAAFRDRFGTGSRHELSGRRLLRLIRIGSPMGIQWVLDMTSWTIFTAIIARLGAVSAAANHIAITLLHVSFMPGWAISTAATTLVGQYLGAGHPPGAKRSAGNALKIAVAFMGLMGLVFFLWRRQLIWVFNEDPAVLDIGADLLIFAAVFQVFDAMSMVAAGILRGSGDTRGPATIQITLSWVFFIPLTYLVCLRLGYGARGGWLAATAYIVLLGVLLYAKYRRGEWLTGALLSEGPTAPELTVTPGPEPIGPPPSSASSDGSFLPGRDAPGGDAP